jgi:hypothetical protein
LVEHNISAAAVIVNRQVQGLMTQIGALRFALVVTPAAEIQSLLSGKSFFRPAGISFSDVENCTIHLAWKGQNGGESVVIGPAEPPATK